MAGIKPRTLSLDARALWTLSSHIEGYATLNLARASGIAAALGMTLTLTQAKKAR